MNKGKIGDEKDGERMLEKPPKILEVANAERMTFRKANRSESRISTERWTNPILIDGYHT